MKRTRGSFTLEVFAGKQSQVRAKPMSRSHWQKLTWSVARLETTGCKCEDSDCPFGDKEVRPSLASGGLQPSAARCSVSQMIVGELRVALRVIRDGIQTKKVRRLHLVCALRLLNGTNVPWWLNFPEEEQEQLRRALREALPPATRVRSEAFSRQFAPHACALHPSHHACGRRP